MMGYVLVCLAMTTIDLPGTQPGDLTTDLRPPRNCEGCHGGYAEYAANDTWGGGMMANAMRDPLFLAALTVANQDAPGAGDLCLRCHTPRGWTMGRSEPPDGSALEPDDFEGVACDFCHRLGSADDPERYLGNAQYWLSDGTVVRGPIVDAVATHNWEYSDYFEGSDICGLCHDVSNPLLDNFPIERTYSEWRNSAFFEEGQQCQSCHMPEVTGRAADVPGAPEDRTIHLHDFAGGSTWMPLVLAGEYPELGREAAFQYASEAARAVLRTAATVEIQAPEIVEGGDSLDFVVRVENLTGHKLPTGYPEGRLCWLEVLVTGEDGEELLHSGVYDLSTATRVEDPQLRTYEVVLATDGVAGFHFVTQNQVLQDNRIPPRGFVPQADTQVVGRQYQELGAGVLAHWDEAPYTVEVPRGMAGELSVEVTLWYQSVSRDYVEALRAYNVTDSMGEELVQLWEQYGRSPPEAMASSVTQVRLGQGTGPGDTPPLDPSGCSCQGAGGSVLWFWCLVGFLGRYLLPFRRRAPRNTP